MSQQDLWARFGGLPNDKATLRSKAIAVAPLLLRYSKTVLDFCADLHKNTGPELKIENNTYNYFEVLVVLLHLFDRIIFVQLNEHREWFFDCVFNEVTQQVAALSDAPHEAMIGSFSNLFRQRACEYAQWDFPTQKNQQGGHATRKSLAFHVAKQLGCDHFIVENAIEHILIYTLSQIQLSELLRGYSKPQMHSDDATRSPSPTATPTGTGCLLLLAAVCYGFGFFILIC